MSELPPFVLYFIAALLVAVTRGTVRQVILLATPLIAGLHLWFNIDAGVIVTHSIMSYELTAMRADKLGLLFAYLFCIASFIASIFSLHLKDTKQHVAGVMYAGSAVGAVLAGDLITLFIFWELLAVSSVFLIWARSSERAFKAGMRYLVFQVLSGLLLLAGALVYYHDTGSLAFDHIGLDMGVAGWLIFIAFGIKAAFPFLHGWLIDGYPEATVTGMVFLTAFSTKVAVYALARGFAGEEILVYIGVTMACFPLFYAAIENDLRKVLAYCLINQMGFMVTGIGIGTALALNGVVAHAFSHVIYKGLLFMTVGAVLYRAGSINGSDLGGLYKSMPKTTVLGIVGALAIAFPLFSGFISKSMVMSALMYGDYGYLWLLMLFASAGVFHLAGIKVPYFAFFAQDSGIRTEEAPRNMLVAMSLAAALCLFIGMQPQYLYALLPWEAEYWPYDVTHVLAQLQLLFFSALAFVWLNKKGLYPLGLPSVNLDMEWFYRKLLPVGVRRAVLFLRSAKESALTAVTVPMQGIQSVFSQSSVAKYYLSESWPTGSMVFWISIILAAYLLLGIFG